MRGKGKFEVLRVTLTIDSGFSSTFLHFHAVIQLASIEHLSWCVKHVSPPLIFIFLQCHVDFKKIDTYPARMTLAIHTQIPSNSKIHTWQLFIQAVSVPKQLCPCSAIASTWSHLEKGLGFGHGVVFRVFDVFFLHKGELAVAVNWFFTMLEKLLVKSV